MKKIVSSLVAVAAAVAMATPVSAHPQTVTDAAGDAYDSTTSGVTSGIDLSGATFTDTKKSFIIDITMHTPVPVELLCTPTDCGETPSNIGYFDTGFYNVKKDTVKNSYYVGIAQQDGVLIGSLYMIKGEESQLKAAVPVTATADNLSYTVTVPRNKLNGHKKGMKLYWNVRSVFWNAADSSSCVFDGNVEMGNACVDWIPDTQDAEHAIKK